MPTPKNSTNKREGSPLAHSPPFVIMSGQSFKKTLSEHYPKAVFWSHSRKRVRKFV